MINIDDFVQEFGSRQFVMFARMNAGPIKPPGQGFVEGRIPEINGKMACAQVIDVTEIDTDKIIFGATVKLFDVESENEVTYRIVGQDEADIKKGLISINSPVAKALIGHRIDDEVNIKVPSGMRAYEIIDIQYV